MVITAGLDGAARMELLASAAATACGWSGLPPSASPTPACPWTRRSRPVIPCQEAPAWRLQSGGVGVVLLEHLSRLGVGISSFVSLGDKDDVSGNDMLLWCESDTATKLAVLYLESFGNPASSPAPPAASAAPSRS